MRSLPGITVISPADSLSTIKATLAATEHNQSVYLRLTGPTPNPTVYSNDFDFKIGKSNTLIENGDDIALVSCGSMVSNSVEVINLLKKRKVGASLFDMHTIKPIDREVLKKINKNFKLLVTFEEHSIIGGLGSAVAEYISSLRDSIPILALGIPDFYETAASYSDLISKYKLNPEQIADRIFRKMCSLRT